MKKVYRFFVVWMVIVLSFGNPAIGFAHHAESNVNVNGTNSSGAFLLTSRWIQTNWPSSNSFFNLSISKNKVFARIWDSFNGGRMYLNVGNGASWNQIGSADNSIDILSIIMLDSRILAGTWDGFIESADEGTTWNAITPTGVPTDTPIWSIAMIKTTLFAGNTGGIHKSLDNGNTWTDISSGIPEDARITSLVANGEDIFAGSASNGVFKLINGGTSWTAINSNLTDTHISQLIVLDNKLFAVTLTGVFISDNSGTSWKADLSLLKNISCMVAVNNQLIAGTDESGTYVSLDKGITWTSFSQGMPANTRIWSLAVSKDSIFAGTSSGIWVMGLPTEVQVESETSVPVTFALKQNYPNPFNSATTISFEIPQQTFIELSVYDIKGEKIQTIVKGNYGAGNYSMNFDASLLSSGVYFYQLKYSQGIITNKMLLIK